MTIRIAELTDPVEHQAVATLFQRIWRDPQLPVDPPMLRALSHAGNYVSGAYAGEELVGAAVAFLGIDNAVTDRPHLHSHITGVLSGHRASGVGYALKQHQRSWSLDRGIGRVCWTYDPLVRRNAYFNFHKLGAEPVEYLPDFYGHMADGINAGDLSDRMYISWDLSAPRAVAAANGVVSDVELAGAAVRLDHDGDAPGKLRRVGSGPVLVAIPADIEKLRGSAPEVASAWRLAVREAMVGCFAEGRRVVGVARDGWYVMSGRNEAAQ
ncbi:GNAT family N-acetyltransferase [Fodinicola acaciae]|uniref:GNAT family N-acetyltransferase n=1 Tax=Fodinicola acaciae TaxID=2681555 RepID=UPI0013D72DBF|nr:GNAT family N-acetyltransferase [Fodinicola acaciae]